MNITILFAVIAGVGIAWYIISVMMMVNELMKRGEKINFVFITAMFPAYAHRFKKITLKETGKVGLLFYHWVIAIITTLVFAIAAIISEVA
jgi:hypothetical protein